MRRDNLLSSMRRPFSLETSPARGVGYRKMAVPPSKKGFSLMEMLVTLSIIVIILVLIFPGIQYALAKAKLAQCVSNFRQLGAAAASFAAENNNEWPYAGPVGDQGGSASPSWSSPFVRSGSWVGLGKTFPYHLSPKLFFCPADNTTRPRVIQTADWSLKASGGITGDYLARGYNQTLASVPLGRKFATLGRRAIGSCHWWSNGTSDPRYQLSYHDGQYPVLFSDGSVQIMMFPKGTFDPKNPPDITKNNQKQTAIWLFFDGKRETP